MDVEKTIAEFDHHALTVSDDPSPVFAELRRRPPLWVDRYGGYRVFSRYRDVREIANDDERFSSAGGVTIPPQPEDLRTIPIEIDPPEFHVYRRFMNPTFTPKRAEEAEAACRTDVHRLVDRFIAQGEVEIMDDLAMPIPAMGILRTVGIDDSEWRTFWNLTSPHRPERNRLDRDDAALEADQMIAVQKVMELLEVKKRSPGRDFLTRLATESLPNGSPVELEKAMKMTLLVFFGGFGTTTAVIGSALHYLGTHPDRQAELRERKDLLRSATEEFLRCFAPVIGLARTVAVDTEVGGVKLAKSERIYLLWAAANRDDEEFEAPEEVRFDREPNRHMGFGVGAHRCIGSHVARMQIRVALEILLERLGEFSVLEAVRPETSPSGVRGFDVLRLRFAGR